MMANMQDYRVRILDFNENKSRHIVTDFRFEGETQWTKPPQRDMEEGKVPLLLCKCGHREFNEDGRFINEYCCPSCDQYIEILYKDEPNNTKG